MPRNWYYIVRYECPDERHAFEALPGAVQYITRCIRTRYDEMRQKHVEQERYKPVYDVVSGKTIICLVINEITPTSLGKSATFTIYDYTEKDCL